MKRNFKAIVCILIALVHFNTRAQKNSIDNMLTIELKSTGILEQQNKVKGYYSFYMVEKADEDNSIYLLRIFDENAKEIISEKFKESKSLTMVEAAFDNEAILLKFQISNKSEKVSKYYIYNQSKQLKPIAKPTLNKEDGQYSLNIGGPETLNYGLYAIPKQGFINYSPYITDETHGYEIFHLDSNGNKKWSVQSQTKEGEKDIAKILLASKSNLYSLISNYEETSRGKSKKGNYIVQYLNCIDIGTGKKRFETKLEDEQYRYQVLSGQGSESDENITLLGLYFPKVVKMDSEEPWGIFSARIDSKGAFSDIKHLMFGNSMDKYFRSENNRSFSSIGHIYIHNVFQTADKKIYAVAENYGTGYDQKLRLMEFKVKNLLVFEFNPDFTIAEIRDFSLPLTKMYKQLEGENNTYKIAVNAKQKGLFGYLFTQLSPDKSSFIIGHVTLPDERKIKIFGPRVITSVNYGAIVHRDSNYATDKIELKISGDILRPLNAKFGHVLITGYIKDEKKQEIRLEKINF